ncbi:unnamed protein product [Porites lobata]|uniref:SRCR domain-containing protein n=1 Tax=Porites lobata TaxID=104759 RepID=A0ABN8N7S6_9CNID|nr:unnamed protein product [Porites lobata]
MLGFPGALSAPRSATFGQGTGTIRLGDVGCKGSKANLAHCSHKDYIADCNHLHDAGAVCREGVLDPQPRIPYRLVEGLSRSEGRVEVFHNRQWGTICNRGSDLTAATIMCQMLAYTGAMETSSYGK